jgi:hypothetical protein
MLDVAACREVMLRMEVDFLVLAPARPNIIGSVENTGRAVAISCPHSDPEM